MIGLTKKEVSYIIKRTEIPINLYRNDTSRRHIDAGLALEVVECSEDFSSERVMAEMSYLIHYLKT